MELTLKQIADLLNGTLEGDGNKTVRAINPIEDSEPGSIAFLSNPKYEHYLYRCRASAVVISNKLELKTAVNPALIRVKDPYTSFTTLLEEYQRLQSLQKIGIEEPVHIGKGSAYGDQVYLGAFSYLGENVKIGNHVKIYPHAYIGDHVKIGDHTIIYPGVKIYANTIIGDYCSIHAGAVIGSDGFGFAPQPDGSYRKIPQVGRVVLKDHVDIGANATIDRATLKSTTIQKGVKIDNLVQIAHNVTVGENTVVAAQTGISGSTTIGSQVLLGGQVGVGGHLHVADGTKAGGQTGITRSINESDRTLFGTPAVDKMDYMKSYAIYKKLPELMDQIRHLEQKVINLPSTKN